MDDIAGQATLTHSTRLTLTGMLIAGLISGCAGSNVTLHAPSIPVPLIHKIPASVGLRMPANFHNYVHEEQVYGKEEWSIDLGGSNAALFTQLFDYMFENVIVLKAGDDPKKLPIDALIEPSIDAFEFSVPNQSKTDSFAVWIRYRIRVFDFDGNEVANWPVSAYGKSQTASVSGSQALQRAAILAMRDAAALMIMKLDETAGISEMAKLRATIAVPETSALEESSDESD
jgi:hypothetical protein